MIRLEVPPDLTPRERYGLEVLIDLSRLLVVENPEADVARVAVGAGTGSLDRHLRQGPDFERESGRVRLPRTLLGHVTDVAGAALEQASPATDRHGRVPAELNPLVQTGREREPLIQRWAVALREAVTAAADRRAIRLVAPWPDGRRWAAAISHDLDVVAAWPAFTALRLAQLLRAGDARRAGRVLRAAWRAVPSDPVAAGVRHVLAVERDAGIRTTWFVLCGTPTPRTWLRGDLTYRVDSARARRLLDDIRRQGHEVGLHGSFRTALEADRMQNERARLGRVLGNPPAGVRQHFLRVRPGRTEVLMADAGFGYDSSFGFADRTGFRLGVADVVPAWGAKIELAPLTWMDRALSKYRGVEEPDRWIADALELVAAVRSVEGLWVGLWHPNLTDALGFPDAAAAFRRLVERVTATSPWTATLAEVVAWRRHRRYTRASHVAPDGRVALVTPASASWSVTVENG